MSGKSPSHSPKSFLRLCAQRNICPSRGPESHGFQTLDISLIPHKDHPQSDAGHSAAICMRQMVSARRSQPPAHRPIASLRCRPDDRMESRQGRGELTEHRAGVMREAGVTALSMTKCESIRNRYLLPESDDCGYRCFAIAKA
jgi:hypothetical protein